ncbi:hypothetical protein [Sphingomonas sp.]
MTARHTQVSVAIGFSLWLIGLLYIRFAGPLGAFEGWGAVASYVLVWPLTALSIRIGQRVAGLGNSGVVRFVTVAGVTAMLLDAILLRFLPALYHADAAIRLDGAVWLIWGFATAFALALAMQRD